MTVTGHLKPYPPFRGFLFEIQRIMLNKKKSTFNIPRGLDHFRGYVNFLDVFESSTTERLTLQEFPGRRLGNRHRQQYGHIPFWQVLADIETFSANAHNGLI